MLVILVFHLSLTQISVLCCLVLLLKEEFARDFFQLIIILTSHRFMWRINNILQFILIQHLRLGQWYSSWTLTSQVIFKSCVWHDKYIWIVHSIVLVYLRSTCFITFSLSDNVVVYLPNNMHKFLSQDLLVQIVLDMLRDVKESTWVTSERFFSWFFN